MDNIEKTILITGSTDGIGLETAKTLISKGHKILIHGRSLEKLEKVKEKLLNISKNANIETFLADLSDLQEMKKLASKISEKYKTLDVIINNAGIYKTTTPITKDGFDIRFVVNTIAPYFLIKLLNPLFHKETRIINLSSAAQAPVSIEALLGKIKLSHGEAYAQSKLALSMLTIVLAQELEEQVSTIISVNPASLLATKMVREGYGISGNDINIGSNILVSISLDDKFSNIKGDYFDNDIGEFALLHPDVENKQKCKDVVFAIEKLISKYK